MVTATFQKKKNASLSGWRHYGYALCPGAGARRPTGESARASTGTGIVDIDIIVVFCVVDIDIIVLSFFRKPCC